MVLDVRKKFLLASSVPLRRLNCSLLTYRRPPESPLFPYTTLFRSTAAAARTSPRAIPRSSKRWRRCPSSAPCSARRARSEEHTSELQSLRHLVCRLLLEKKNQKHYQWRRKTGSSRRIVRV